MKNLTDVKERSVRKHGLYSEYFCSNIEYMFFLNFIKNIAQFSFFMMKCYYRLILRRLLLKKL